MTAPRIIGTGSAVICIVLHGRGQTQDDTEQAVTSRLSLAEMRCVLPKSARPAWYDARAVDPLTEVTRAQLAEGLAAIDAVVAEERADHPGVPLVLAGFSQGACMAVEYAMTRGPWHGALCLFTGCRVGTDHAVTALAGLPVYASCGDADPWIPASAFLDMSGDLIRAGARFRSDLFPGRPHEVHGTEIAMLQGILTDLAAGRAPLDGGAL
ncbi:MAG: dienelactone hydrolase family protein [Rhodobacterales bacterium]|nr:dienelactone hydrolase family protein [Rhodobacterales bacterium]